MSQAMRLLRSFGSKLHEIHFSDVDASNRHRVLNHPALAAFSRIRSLCDFKVPVILETLADESEAKLQLELTEKFFNFTCQLLPA